MFSLLADASAVAASPEASLSVALEWLPWIVLIAAAVAVVLAVLVKGIYLCLHIFSKKG
ncbi:MAG: hypothetical protein IJN19_00480 [Opitutales bacterium]|nr:hypothetical protein [Opitutales bacterium]